jgi:hypothetical protein
MKRFPAWMALAAAIGSLLGICQAHIAATITGEINVREEVEP